MLEIVAPPSPEPIKAAPEKSVDYRGTDWVNISEAIQILGLPREMIMQKIHNAQIPFRMVGSQYRLNIKVTRAYLAREDIANMQAVHKEINAVPSSRNKVTQETGRRGNGRIRKQ
jgi:excisionase family DNA binding protein